MKREEESDRWGRVRGRVKWTGGQGEGGGEREREVDRWSGRCSGGGRRREKTGV